MASPARVVVRKPSAPKLVLVETVDLPPRTPRPPSSERPPSIVGTAVDLPALQWSTARRLAFFRAACREVAALHARGRVHGKLCAGSIVLNDRFEPHLDECDSAPAAHELAPEVREGRPVSIASDVFGLGRLLWFLVTDGTETEPRADTRDPIAAVVHRACAVDRYSRHDSVDELLAQLDEAEARPHDRSEAEPRSRDDAPRTPRRRSPEPPRRARKRWPAIASAVVAAFALFAGAKGAVMAAEVLAFIAAMLLSMALVMRMLSARA